jgi:hypothetical protein
MSRSSTSGTKPGRGWRRSAWAACCCRP